MSDITVNANETERRNKVIVFVNGREEVLDQSVLGLTFESSETDVLSAIQGILTENLADENGDVTYSVRRATNSQNLLVYPKPTAG